MNILHIISAPASGGAEVYVKDLAMNLSNQGHNLHIAFLSNASDIGRDIIYEERFLNDLKSSGINIFVIGNETRKKPWLGMLRIKRYISDHNIDICHTHLAYGVFFSFLLMIPVVYTHHTISPRWGKFTYTLFNKIVDEYVGISKACATALSGYTGKNVNVIMNAIADDKFRKYIRVRNREQVITIAMVGRLNIHKDYLNMLQALNLLDETYKNRIRVLIAGEGDKDYKKKLMDFIEQKKLTDTVAFFGVKENIPEFLYQADVFLMSSSTEGLPIALIEATISGLPCIVTNVGGCAEVIENSKNGIVVPPKNSQALADAIIRLINQPKLIEEYSRNAIQSSTQYSISKSAKLHLDLYSSILSK